MSTNSHFHSYLGAWIRARGARVLSYFYHLAQLPSPSFSKRFSHLPSRTRHFFGFLLHLQHLLPSLCDYFLFISLFSGCYQFCVRGHILCWLCLSYSRPLKFIFKQYLYSANTHVDISRILHVHDSFSWLLGYLLGSSKQGCDTLPTPKYSLLWILYIHSWASHSLNFSDTSYYAGLLLFSLQILLLFPSIYITKSEIVEQPHCHHALHLDGCKRPLFSVLFSATQLCWTYYPRQILLSQPFQPRLTSLTKSLMPLNSSPYSPSQSTYLMTHLLPYCWGLPYYWGLSSVVPT